jgi:hypothetical protein
VRCPQPAPYKLQRHLQLELRRWLSQLARIDNSLKDLLLNATIRMKQPVTESLLRDTDNGAVLSHQTIIAGIDSYYALHLGYLEQ